MERSPRVAILWHGDGEARQKQSVSSSRFDPVFKAFEPYGIIAEPAVYHDAFVGEVREQLLAVDGVLVWVNPIQDGMNRTVLDNMLRDVASRGVFVSTHPDVILKLGTKEVLYQTREMGWGGDIRLYRTLDELREGLLAGFARGETRVLKQNRGNNGIGIWRVDPLGGSLNDNPPLRVLHAERDSAPEQTTLNEFLVKCADYFDQDGQMIDQPFYSPVPKGMVRCYMSHDQVVGFGHQHVTALLPSESGAQPPAPQPRIYHPETFPTFQGLKEKMQSEWIPELQQRLHIDRESLPIIWDADFLCRSVDSPTDADFVLCEINVSSVYPYPDSAIPYFVRNAAERIRKG